jgi:hypothetical protein
MRLMAADALSKVPDHKSEPDTDFDRETSIAIDLGSAVYRMQFGRDLTFRLSITRP